MNIINSVTEKISDFKIERMDILQKTQEKEIEYIPIKEENTRNKINLMLVDEWSSSEEKKFCKHRISKFTLTATSCVLSYFGVLEKSKTNALIIFFCFGVVLLVNNFSFSNKVLKRFLKDKNIINTILLLTSVFVTSISITSNYICTRHFTDFKLLNIFSAVMVDILPLAYNYMYEMNVLENEIKQAKKQNTQALARVKNAPDTRVSESSQTMENRAIDTNTCPSKIDTKKPHVRRTSASKITQTDLQKMIDANFEDGEIIEPSKVNMTGNSNFRNWMPKMNNVVKDNKTGKWKKQKQIFAVVPKH